MKSYTDLEQSKRLAEILSSESADMMHDRLVVIPFNDGTLTPCWSLAALLATLPNEIITDNRFECHYQIHIRKYDGGDNTPLYQIAYGNNRGSSGSWHDMVSTSEQKYLIDCCVEMIFWLRENNLLAI